MKKYLFIIKTQIISNLQYIANILFNFLGYLIMLFILFNLWEYLYQDSSEVINGYTSLQMTWYVIITEILWMSLGGRKLCNKITDDVKSGNITYNINKPYDYVKYSLATHIGDISIKFIVYSILGILTGLLFLDKFPNITLLSVVITIITSILATIISILLIISIGLIAFYIEDSKPFYWVYSKAILILGTIFPIEYFPEVMQKFLEYSPIYAISYGPAKLFIDFTIDKAINIIIMQLVYLVIAYLLCQLIYRKGVKRINVNGG